uniref:CYP450 n=1 Tax=Locusta migratoria TaxID=7004 RepID=A0A6F8GZI3_LOCMI|nr:CYP450 [Locusta migratoria]
MWGAALLAGALALLAWCVAFLRRRASHWRARGLPHLRPRLLFGNALAYALSRQSCAQLLEDAYRRLAGHALGGFHLLWRPALLVRDPALAGRLLVHDFESFRDRGYRPFDPMLQDLFFLRGDHRWRTLRESLEPGFGPKGARYLFFLLDEMALRLVKVLETPAERCLELEVFEQMQRFVIDTVGTCAFGVEFETMLNYDSFVLKETQRMISGSFLKKIKKTLLLAVPETARAMGMRFVRPEDAAVFRWLTAEIVAHRRRNNVRRGDLIQLLMALAAKEADAGQKDGFGGEMLSAQVMLLLMLGRQKVAAALAFCLHLLAAHPEEQTRARVQVDAALRRHHQQLSLQALQDMPYLDMVLSETLRLHPPMSNVTRGCTAAYTFRGASRLGDGCLRLQPGEAPVMVPVCALHRDPAYFPQPDRFLPDRFAPDNASQHTPYTYMPFGAGKRSCLGEHLSLVLMKTTLARLLSRYELFPSPRTEYPSPVDPRQLLLSPRDGLWIKISNRHWLPCD